MTSRPQSQPETDLLPPRDISPREAWEIIVCMCLGTVLGGIIVLGGFWSLTQ